eukprot:TRINITY_DN10218_c0_g2_i2.p2 TRINITY_DN10218_c0_g2~~TRINITY_DN10218_c0_g2_i2.p2  ORF type:complete len:140 (-),score=4.89 TRINITY_DN10218_c0_g2_i2:343-762(-)
MGTICCICVCTTTVVGFDDHVFDRVVPGGATLLARLRAEPMRNRSSAIACRTRDLVVGKPASTVAKGTHLASLHTGCIACPTAMLCSFHQLLAHASRTQARPEDAPPSTSPTMLAGILSLTDVARRIAGSAWNGPKTKC